ncbi:hypothetical protein JCM19992_07150 [Thermostilla marina]
MSIAAAVGVLFSGFTGNARAAQPAGIDSLIAAIDHLEAKFGSDYPLAEAFRSRARELAEKAEHASKQKAAALQESLRELAYEALVRENPLVNRAPILFVVRQQYLNDHHNTATMFQTGEINESSFRGGGAMRLLHVDTGRVETLIELPEGVVRDPDVSFDGRRILFSMRRNIKDDYHIYELTLGENTPRQLTFGSGVSDIDPIYLPDGRICFTATREPKFCMCNRHIMGNLFVMNADGSNIIQIGRSTLHEGHAALLPDGRILYDRWEYVDRNFGDAQGLWTVRPDGTNHALFWGNNTNSPGGVIDARPIPDSPLFVSVFTSCHDRPWGALALVDRRLGMDGREPVVRTWPPEAIDLVGVGNYDTFKRLKIKYEDPYPLSAEFFLCSRMTGNGEEMALYLVDVFGNEVPVYREAPGCFDPMPLAPRTRPPVLPPTHDLAAEEGYFYVVDVYRGFGMDRIPRGSIKYLRVVESPEKRFWTKPAWNGGTGQQAPGMAWDDFNNKRILGTVPVEEDGSVYFAVPALKYVYFQLVDDKGRMVQSMRSGTIVQPGERIGCVGCHEDRRESVLTDRLPSAMQRPPEKLTPWYGPPRTFSYTAEVQPVFDRHCVQCHNYDRPAGDTLNLCGDLNLVFNMSYVELRRKGYVKVVGAGPAQTQPPRSWGSHASRLAEVVLEGHGDPAVDSQIHLTAEDIDRILTWIDINAPYYPEYAAGAYGDNPFGRSPLTAAELQRLEQLTGVAVSKNPFIDQVDFTRPEKSRCLTKLEPSDDPDSPYQQALALIEGGRNRLAASPRPDMTPEYQLAERERLQQQKYDRLRQIEEVMRRAAVDGRRMRLPADIDAPELPADAVAP